VQERFSWLLLSTRGQPCGERGVPLASDFDNEFVKPLQDLLLLRDIVLGMEQHAFGERQQIVQFGVHIFATNLNQPCFLGTGVPLEL
jgi:hypothetical protein